MVNVKPKGNRWRIEIYFRWPDGVPYRKRLLAPVMGKSAALRWGQQCEANVLAKGRAAVQAPKEAPAAVPTLTAFWPRFIADGKANRQKASTLHAKETIARLYLTPALGGLRLNRIDAEQIAQLKARLAKYAPKTVNNVLTCLSAALRLATSWGVIAAMPKITLLKAAPPEMSFLEEADLDRLLAAASNDARIVILLGADAGLRLGEMISLRWSACDLVRGILHVRQASWRGVEDSPKGGRGRAIPMTQRLRAGLKAYRHLRSDRVLVREDGRPVNAPLIGRWIGAATRRAGLAYAEGAHILRHTFCSRLAMAGASPKSIQELAGHRNLTTTQRYLHLSPAAREGAIRLLDAPSVHGTPMARDSANDENAIVSR
jgi:integrase